MGKIVNFHVPAADPERAVKFYGEVFGWTFTPHPDAGFPYFVHDGEGAGIPAAIVGKGEIITAPAPTIEVEHIDQAMIDIATKGGQQGRVFDIAGLGRYGYAIDSEGNIIALLQRV